MPHDLEENEHDSSQKMNRLQAQQRVLSQLNASATDEQDDTPGMSEDIENVTDLPNDELERLMNEEDNPGSTEEDEEWIHVVGDDDCDENFSEGGAA